MQNADWREKVDIFFFWLIMREKNFILLHCDPLFWAVKRQKVSKAKVFWGWIWHEIEGGFCFFLSSLSEL
jgi:hypothetical protein